MAISKNVIVNTSGVDLYSRTSASNPDGTNTYFTAAGVPWASGSTYYADQPKVVGGAMLSKFGTTAGMASLDPVVPGQASFYNAGVKNPTTYRGLNNGVTSVFSSGSCGAFRALPSGGYCAFTGTTVNDYFRVGTILYIGPSGASTTVVASTSGINSIYGVHTVTTSTIGSMDFVTDKKDIKGIADAASKNFKVTAQALSASYTFSNINKGAYVGSKLTNQIAGVYDTTLRSMSNNPSQNGLDIHRSIKKREAFRTTKILTALRAGSYNRFTGKWNVAPTVANDAGTGAATGAMTADHAATVNPRKAAAQGVTAEIVIKSGKPKPWTPVLDGAWFYGVKTG